MAIKYLAGNRIQGTDAERLATLGFIEDGSNTVLKFTKVVGTAFDNLSATGSDGVMCKDEQGYYATQIGTSHSGIGTNINRVSFMLKKTGLPTGNMKAKIYSGDVETTGNGKDAKTVVATSTTTLDISTLTTSYTEKVFEFASDRTVAAGDNYSLEMQDGTDVSSSSKCVKIGYNSTATTNAIVARSPYGSTNGTVQALDWYYNPFGTGYGLAMKIYGVGGTNTFTPSGSFNVEYLVVAGGGGSSAGAGGAGGYRTATGFGVTAQTYSITVGAGGAKSSASGSIVGGNGGDSIFSSITSTGGGGGAKVNDNGVAGGSGGAGAPKSSATTTGGAGTSGQGYAGGGNGGYTASPYQSGGGGGASQVGFDASSATQSGAGGDGLASSITGTSTYYAGGGGGSAWQGTGSASGGLGGGGAGSPNAGYSIGGTPNTGGGAGAGNSSNAVQNGTSDGGSGIVVLKFATSNSFSAVVDGITSPTKLEDGSIFETTDTNKHYIWNSSINTWTEVA